MSRGARLGDYPSSVSQIYEDWLQRRQGLLLALTDGARAARWCQCAPTLRMLSPC